MTITQWEYALALDKFRHFGKAARACSVAQPTLSMQLHKLEDELGVILFDRSKSPILPTSEGEALLRQARVALKEFKKISELVDQLGDNLQGRLRFSVIPTLTPYLVPLFASKFTKLYPDVELVIQEHTTEEIIRLLENDEIDVGCLATPLKEDQIIERVLFYEPFGLYVSPENELFAKETVRESDLKIEELWLLTEGHCFRNQVLRFCKMDAQTRFAHENLSFESGHLETLKNMVDQGGGYTLLPQLAIDQLSTKDKKNVRFFDGETPTREVSLVHSRTFLKERLIMALESTVIESIPKSLKSYKGQVIDVF